MRFAPARLACGAAPPTSPPAIACAAWPRACLPVPSRRRPDGGFELSLSTPASGVLRSVHFARGTPVQFAAIIPGDGVAEVVLTSGLNNFL